jgi:hypothetical protein
MLARSAPASEHFGRSSRQQTFLELPLEEEAMGKDRGIGSAKQIKGSVKEVVGKAFGDAELESEGKRD